MLTPAIAHLACIALVILDLLVRVLRLQIVLRDIGVPARTWDVFVANTIGEAAAALTPMRIGGQPARMYALVRMAVPMGATLTAIAAESVMLYPLMLLVGVIIALLFAPAWWEQIAPRLEVFRDKPAAWSIVLAALIIALVVVLIWRRRGAPRVPEPGSRQGSWLARKLAPARAIRPVTLALQIPLSLVNICARVAMLPLLALALPTPPELAVLITSSYALLYGQIFIPTPGGAGVVEASVLAGAAGDLGTYVASTLLWWRVYTIGVGVVLGAIAGGMRFGMRPLLDVLRRRPAAGQ